MVISRSLPVGHSRVWETNQAGLVPGSLRTLPSLSGKSLGHQRMESLEVPGFIWVHDIYIYI